MDQSRRDFLKTAGCLTIGFSLSALYPAGSTMPLQELPGSLQRYPGIDAWLEVLANGSVRVFTGKIELGQGIRIAIAQVAAEELDLAIDRVSVSLAETGVTPNESYTAGSASIETSAMSVRYAAAAARQKLLQLAAMRLGVPAAELQLSDGKIHTKDKKRTLTFAEVLDGKKLDGEIKMPVPLKAKQDYRYSGKPVPRQNLAAMVNGGPIFVHDLRFPGMLHARIVRPPVYEARLDHFNEANVRSKVPELQKVVVNGNFLAVIAKGEYAAMQAQKILSENTKWTFTKPLEGGNDLPAHLRKLPVKSESVQQKGEMLTGGATMRASYFKPYIMHGATGPSCAVALYDKDQLHIWTHSQGVYPLRESLKDMLQLPAERIHIKGVPGAGCFGHNGADDVAAEAALLAMQVPGKHIRLQWSRQEEHGWEPYGSAMLMDAAAILDARGRISHWQYALWSDTHSTRPGGKAANLLPARYLQKPFASGGSTYSGGASRNSEPYYNFPNLDIKAHTFRGPLRVSALRSLGAFANIFAIESFMEELAVAAGKDAYTFRLMHLEDERAIAVLQKLQSIAVAKEHGKDHGMGIAFARYKNTAAYAAVAAQVQVTRGQVTVQKMWAVIDAGEIINPDGIKNQTEGGMVQAASWTLREQVQYDTQIRSLDWFSYPVLPISEAPEVEVALINRPTEEPLGAGEAVQGPAGAAIANAVYHATGKRVRALPILPEKLL
ncbi:molybdopterin cofactor-binding domain-containing protein [uncultured Chitinophaga sp.]|jgi:Aerobic-type carbon monoxide dehydrogenase, large subunit CoxL/CutL homologs|uniref:xanthine dehydrogenase family protein molybdopterin-binding subunit n=1 Tax=uncultured Chitinophaga sp. TaxID=339340 RepID=UPI0026204BDA|nr:molybdopterin cofactor-binding domain-containing protein [uncultured Chitinophaga sp.]